MGRNPAVIDFYKKNVVPWTLTLKEMLPLTLKELLPRSFCENSINGVELELVSNFRDLGVLFESTLCFTSNIAKLVATAKQRISLLFRSFKTRDQNSLMQAYKSYIIPILGYCSPIWSPGFMGDILLIESFQRNFTRNLPGFEYVPYTDRLRMLNLPSLELRRLYADLVLCFKILHSIISRPPINYGLIISDRKSRGNSLKLRVDHVRVDVRKHYFSNRVCGPWNNLSDEIVNCGSVNSFKRLIRSCNFTKFLNLPV